MTERLTDPKAGNWVDRGEPPDEALGRVLAYYLNAGPDAREDQLRVHVNAIRGMVDADSTEVHLAGYLKDLEREFGISEQEARSRRAAAVALWHIAKVAEVRERARRLIEFGVRE